MSCRLREEGGRAEASVTYRAEEAGRQGREGVDTYEDLPCNRRAKKK